MPGMYAASGRPALSTPWSSSRTPRTFFPSTSARATGVPGQIWTVPVARTCPLIHCMSWPIEKTKPSFLWRNSGVKGSSIACSSTGSTPFIARMDASAARSVRERRLAPMGSRRYSTFSSRTGVAIGICEGSRSGKAPRMPRARVTTPDTPKPRSSARS